VSFTLERLYSCDGTDIDSETSPGTITAVTGTHTTDKSSADVQGIRLWDENCNLKVFPPNFVDFFPNLTSVWINDCGLTEISAKSFERLTGLVEIDLAFNRLQFVHGNLLRNFGSLKFLYLNDNEVSYVGPNLVQPLKSLIYVTLENNLCIDAKYFDFESEDSASDLRNFVIDLAILCPLTVETVGHFFGFKNDQKLEPIILGDKSVILDNFQGHKSHAIQENKKREINRQIMKLSLQK
jgi:Leucine-rich repeat (LRR) protein